MDSLETNPKAHTETELSEVLRKQKEYFFAGKTRPLKGRLSALKNLKDTVKSHEREILKALHEDLRKPEFEAYGSELGVFYQEIDHLLKNLKFWMKPKQVATPWSLFPSRSQIRYQPYGKVLLFSPFNYPFQLFMIPLAGALAAGNTVVGKPSEHTPNTSQILRQIVAKCFPPELAHVALGGAEVGEMLSSQADFDLIFFTGSPAIGKKVAVSAAQNLTPTVMELGGKSPAIVTASAPIQTTARRIVWGKFFNAGQTCIAPDYLLVPEEQHSSYLTALIEEIQNLYGEDPSRSPDYGRIVSVPHLRRLNTLLEGAQVVHGGQSDEQSRYLAPTLLSGVKWTDSVMQEEIFGPVLPVLTYSQLDEVLGKLQTLPSPLALYVFSSSEEDFDKVAESVRFGGGAFNDTLVQYLSPKLPIGGVGMSGWGHYRGHHSFETFSHRQGVVFSSPRVDLPLRYPPYKKGTLALLRRIMG